jgi:hypothetical protein
MKRQEQISPGVFKYSTGQIGTADLPQFISECAYHKHTISKKQSFMLDNIKPANDKTMPYRGQMARAYAQFLTAKKRRAN